MREWIWKYPTKSSKSMTRAQRTKCFEIVTFAATQKNCICSFLCFFPKPTPLLTSMRWWSMHRHIPTSWNDQRTTRWGSAYLWAILLSVRKIASCTWSKVVLTHNAGTAAWYGKTCTHFIVGMLLARCDEVSLAYRIVHVYRYLCQADLVVPHLQDSACGAGLS